MQISYKLTAKFSTDLSSVEKLPDSFPLVHTAVENLIFNWPVENLAVIN